jgi:hypothetical protein
LGHGEPSGKDVNSELHELWGKKVMVGLAYIAELSGSRTVWVL